MHPCVRNTVRMTMPEILANFSSFLLKKEERKSSQFHFETLRDAVNYFAERLHYINRTILRNMKMATHNLAEARIRGKF